MKKQTNSICPLLLSLESQHKALQRKPHGNLLNSLSNLFHNFCKGFGGATLERKFIKPSDIPEERRAWSPQSYTLVLDVHHCNDNDNNGFQACQKANF